MPHAFFPLLGGHSEAYQKSRTLIWHKKETISRRKRWIWRRKEKTSFINNTWLSYKLMRPLLFSSSPFLFLSSNSNSIAICYWLWIFDVHLLALVIILIARSPFAAGRAVKVSFMISQKCWIWGHWSFLLICWLQHSNPSLAIITQSIQN